LFVSQESMKVLNEIENLDEYDSFKSEAQNQLKEPQCPGDVRGCVYPVFFIGLTAYIIEQKGYPWPS
jgi:hypothetical protein